MKTDTICCYCISKHMTKEALQNHCMHTSLQAYINRARLIECAVGIFSQRETSANTETLHKLESANGVGMKHTATEVLREILQFINTLLRY